MNNAQRIASPATMSATDESRRFAIDLTVDYADTDAGGVVYYANYLAYMERARNAWLRRLGFPLTVLARRHCVLFTVTEAHLHYHAPARLDDELQATLQVMKLRRASIRFRQTVQRAGDGDESGDNAGALVAAEIRLGAVNGDTFKPRRLPAELTDAIERWQRGESFNTVDTVAAGS